MNRKVSVAPMMDCTDRHERFFLRLISKNTLLYTEMVVDEAINRGDKKVLGIRYTPDFVGEDFIIETKGRANESFPMRWKLFKKHMQEIGDDRNLYKPQTNKECDKTIDLILKNRKNGII